MVQSIADELPNGQCKKCGFFLLNTAGKQKTCVNCDIKSEPSGVVNTLEDPGHEAMAKILGSGGASTVVAKEQELIPRVVKPNNVQTDSLSMYDHIKAVQEQLGSLPIRDLKQAKALLKLRKDIDVLANKIQNFIQGE